ncbi:MAG TPA: hypothetical protein VLC09_04095 [Polyangiaceae bacterium]|nr:hypothetical protein [Polyangiaceae bacterium]
MPDSPGTEDSAHLPATPSVPRGEPLLGVPLAVLVDPFDGLVFGALGAGFELSIDRHWSLRAMTSWVVNETPAGFRFDAKPANLRIASGGLGPLSGWATGAGYWFGEPWNGLAVHAYYEGSYYEFSSVAGDEVLDRTTLAHARLMAEGSAFLSYDHFVVGAAFGVGFDLIHSPRCPVGSSCPDDGGHYLKIDGAGGVYDVNGPFAPLALDGSLFLGVRF